MIALYADPAFRSSAGIELYSRELIKGLVHSPLAPRLSLLCSRRDWALDLQRFIAATSPRTPPEVVVAGGSDRVLRYAWSMLGRPSVESLTGTAPVLTHAPIDVRFPSPGAVEVATVHDLFRARMPELVTARERITLMVHMQARAIRTATHLIADSDHTARDISELYGRDRSDITVVPLGVDHTIFRPSRDPFRAREVRDRHGIEGPFLLYVGSLYSRKLGRLPEAFALLRRELGDSLSLVLVGGREAHAKRRKSLELRLCELGVSDHVVRPGVVPTADLPILMGAAEAFVYVSQFEGFGLSVLEALASGAAVVASNTTSLPEVAGDAALLVDPSDEADIAAAISRLLHDSALQKHLKAAASEQAAGFSWERTVERTLAVYGRLLKKPYS